MPNAAASRPPSVAAARAYSSSGIPNGPGCGIDVRGLDLDAVRPRRVGQVLARPRRPARVAVVGRRPRAEQPEARPVVVGVEQPGEPGAAVVRLERRLGAVHEQTVDAGAAPGAEIEGQAHSRLLGLGEIDQPAAGGVEAVGPRRDARIGRQRQGVPHGKRVIPSHLGPTAPGDAPEHVGQHVGARPARVYGETTSPGSTAPAAVDRRIQAARSGPKRAANSAHAAGSSAGCPQ